MTLITKQQVIDVLRGLPRDKVNPVHPKRGTCVYTDLNDPNNHCIAAQVLMDLGLADMLPPVDSERNYQTAVGDLELYGVIEASAIVLLARLQTKADGMLWKPGVLARHEPRPWGDVIDQVLDSKEEEEE